MLPECGSCLSALPHELLETVQLIQSGALQIRDARIRIILQESAQVSVRRRT